MGDTRSAMISLLFAVLVALPPKPSAHLAAWLIGRPEAGPELVAICRRESRCRRLGAHAGDASWSRAGWLYQTRVGHLDAQCQPYGDGDRWSTRGAFGLNAAAHWQFLPACYQPEWFDVPIVSALVAALKWRKVCRPHRDSRWCPARRSKFFDA